MTLKELKQNILRSLYARYKDNSHVSIIITQLADEDSLIFDSTVQLLDAVKSLKDQGFLKATFFMDGDGHISELTPAGIEYVEENLLTLEEQVIDGLKDTATDINNRFTVDTDVENTSFNGHLRPERPSSSMDHFFRAKSDYRKIVDKDAKPCFGIDSLAECFAKQIEKIAESSVDAVPMIGIFGPWGRGKTYFYSRIKDYFKRKQNTKFDFIDFNAWKHRETPAVWAHLYETIYRHSSRCVRIKLFLKDKWPGALKIVIVFVLAWLLSFFLTELPNLSEGVKSLFKDLSLPIVWTGLLSVIIYGFINNPTTALSLIKRELYMC